MDYYKLRSRIMNKVKEHLEHREENLKKGLEPPKFKDFQKKLMLEHGVTESMLRKMVEQLVAGGTVEDGELVRKDV